MRTTFFNSCTRASSITFWIARRSITVASKSCLWRPSTFFDVAIDMLTELLMIGLRRNGCIWCEALLPLLPRMRSSACVAVVNYWYGAVSRLITLLSNCRQFYCARALVVWRSCHIYHTVLHCCQFYFTVVWFSPAIKMMRIYCARTFEFATKF